MSLELSSVNLLTKLTRFSTPSRWRRAPLEAEWWSRRTDTAAGTSRRAWNRVRSRWSRRRPTRTALSAWWLRSGWSTPATDRSGRIVWSVRRTAFWRLLLSSTVDGWLGSSGSDPAWRFGGIWLVDRWASGQRLTVRNRELKMITYGLHRSGNVCGEHVKRNLDGWNGEFGWWSGDEKRNLASKSEFWRSNGFGGCWLATFWLLWPTYGRKRGTCKWQAS